MRHSTRVLVAAIGALGVLLVRPDAGRAQAQDPPAAAVVLRDHPMAYRRVTSPAGWTFWYRHDEITPYAALTADLTFDDGLERREGVRQLIPSAIFQTVDPDGRSDFRERFADIHGGGSLAIGERGASIQARAPGELLGEAVDLIMTLVASGMPTPAAIERTRSNAIANDRQSATGIAAAADRAGRTLLLGDHVLVRSFEPSRFDRFDAADIAAWRATAIQQVPPEIVVSGRIGEAQAAALVDRVFEGWPRGERPARIERPLVAPRAGSVRVTATGRQVAVRMQAPTRVLVGRDRAAAQLAVQVLGGGDRSRLWTTIRGALGAAYGASAGLQDLGDRQLLLGFGASVDSKTATTSISALRGAYAEWRTAGVTEAEFDAVRTRAITTFQSAFRDPGQANGIVVGLLRQGRPVEDIEQRIDQLRALTAHDVNALIKEAFPEPAELLLSIAAPAGVEIAADCTAESWSTVAATCRF
jgi:predicted Zn-dependent peptidase